MGRLRINLGPVYQSSFGNILRELDVREVSIDLRPTSFHFCELKNLIDFLQKNHTWLEKITLVFGNDPDFVIHRVLEEITLMASDFDFDKLLLELPATRRFENCMQLGIPFIWQWEPKLEQSVVKNRLFKGLFLSTRRYLEGGFTPRCQAILNDHLYQWNLDYPWPLPVLPQNWPYKRVNLIIGHALELAYRQPHMEKIKQAYHNLAHTLGDKDDKKLSHFIEQR